MQRHVAIILAISAIIAVLAVLAIIAYPSFSQHLRESRRSDAIVTLARVAAFEDKFSSSCQTYVHRFDGSIQGAPGHPPVCTGLGMVNGAADGTSMNSDKGWYQLSIALQRAGGAPTSGPPAVSYTVSAYAVGSQEQDVTCNEMSINALGTRSASSRTGANTTNICWPH